MKKKEKYLDACIAAIANGSATIYLQPHEVQSARQVVSTQWNKHNKNNRVKFSYDIDKEIATLRPCL
jgi:hypothetical protein